MTRFADQWHGPNRPLPAATRGSYRYYSGGDYENFNNYFRGKYTPTPSNAVAYDTYAQAIDDAMVPVPQDVVMWRGLKYQAVESIIKPRPGESLGDALLRVGEVADGSFMSTSIDRSVSENFGQVLFRIRVPAGTRGRFMDKELSGMAHESEVLWERGRRLRIVSVTEVDKSASWYGTARPNYEVIAEMY